MSPWIKLQNVIAAVLPPHPICCAKVQRVPYKNVKCPKLDITLLLLFYATQKTVAYLNIFKDSIIGLSDHWHHYLQLHLHDNLTSNSNLKTKSTCDLMLGLPSTYVRIVSM